MWRANDHLPVFIGCCNFVRGAHFGETHATNDEYDYSWHIFDCCLSFVFMPVTVTCTTLIGKKRWKWLDSLCISMNFDVYLFKRHEISIFLRKWQWKSKYLVGAWYELLWARPPKNGKCLTSNLSSIASSTISFTIGVQRDIWYVCSVMRSLRCIWYCFFRLP